MRFVRQNKDIHKEEFFLSVVDVTTSIHIVLRIVSHHSGATCHNFAVFLFLYLKRAHSESFDSTLILNTKRVFTWPVICLETNLDLCLGLLTSHVVEPLLNIHEVPINVGRSSEEIIRCSFIIVCFSECKQRCEGQNTKGPNLHFPFSLK